MDSFLVKVNASLRGRDRGLLQSLCKSFLLPLPLQLHQVLGVLGPGIVNPALGLGLALPSTRPLVLVLSNRLRGVPVTNALVAAVQQIVVRHIVLLDVLLDLVERPVGQRVDLDQTGLVDFDDVQVTPLAALAATAARQDSADIEFPVRTLSGLDLGGPVVHLVVGFPETVPVLFGKLIGRLNPKGLVDVDVDQRVALADLVDKSERLREMVQGVEEDEINQLRTRNLELGEHVQGHETRETKGSRLIQVGKSGNSPSQNLWRQVSIGS